MAQELAITKKEYKERREKVLNHLQERQMENAKTIIFSGSEKTFSNDVHYPFRVNNDFYYLTGFDEPDAALVLDPNSDNPYSLYVRPKDESKEIWEGFRYGIEGAKKEFGADACFDIKDVSSGAGFIDERKFVHKMRSIKSDAEIALMRKANEITIQAHRVLEQTVTPGAYEYELQASLENIFKSKGARGWAYPPIVASGKNSCVLHYTTNNERIEDKVVILVDAGCEYNYYASDVTRVYASGGSFTKEQQDLYDIVLAAQEKAISMVKPGNTFNDAHEAACEVIAEGLYGLKMIKDKNDRNELRKYYMHGTGHSLGLDVHDLGIDDARHKKKKAKFKAGMVTTIEPGLYDAKRGIGIRLEDNILVTKNGNENFTEALAK